MKRRNRIQERFVNIWIITALRSCLGVVLLFWLPLNAQAQESLCAEVKMEINQELTLERQAFEAHMRINNGISHIRLEEVHVTVHVTDEEGTPVAVTSNPDALEASFFLRLDTTRHLEDLTIDANHLDFTGSVAPSTSADIYWLIIPAPGASDGIPEGKRYYVGASLSYTIGGERHTTEVAPDYIFVKPLPQLRLEYFLPQEVYGDDPWTPETEPPIPAPLGVLVSNHGFGTAIQVEIESAQPRIVENTQGLLVDFLITGSEVNGEPTTPSLLVNFGDLAPNSAGVAHWELTCSLIGRFEDFTASFTHADALGGQLTSIITEVNSHYLIKDVLVDLLGRDPLRDFLGTVSTEPDALESLALYESDNLSADVRDLSASSTLTPETGTALPTSILTVNEIPAAASEEFWYLHQSISKALGGLGQVSARRSDGKLIAPQNVWIAKTRTENYDWEYSVQLFDGYDTTTPLGTLSYTIVFGEIPLDASLPEFEEMETAYTLREGELLMFTVKAIDPDGTLPVGAGFQDHHDGSGEFRWTPAEGQVGEYPVTLIASDGEFSARAQILIRVETDQVVRLTVDILGNGYGSVSDGEQIDCGIACSATYPKYTRLMLSAMPIPGSTFGGAEGAECTEEGVCAVTLLEETTVTVTFHPSGPVDPSPTPSVVPEPATVMLFGLGLLGIIGLTWRRKMKHNT